MFSGDKYRERMAAKIECVTKAVDITKGTCDKFISFGIRATCMP